MVRRSFLPVHTMFRSLLLALAPAVLVLGAIPAAAAKKKPAPAPEPPGWTTDAYASTYRAVAAAPVLISGATVLVGNGERLDGADVLLQDGRITAVGQGLAAPQGALRVDGTGKWVTPGIIDNHSHLGVYPSPGTQSHADGNEMVNPVTAQVWAEHSAWPQDPGFAAALAGGVTTLQLLPGSANLVGGRGVTLKNVPSVDVQGMKFPGAPHGVKMACGENPKRVYGQKGGPMTRMGNVAGYRAAFIDAQEYAKRRHGADPGKRDLKLDTLAGVLDGEIQVHIHCYRADEISWMLDLAHEFNFKIASIHHGVEAYKLADRLAGEGVCASLWADWWGFKMESFDGIQENLVLVDRPANSCAIVHSDSPEGIQRLNQEAAKSMAAGRRVGIDVAPERAIQWLTQNPARSLGVLDQTGTLEAGKMADVVLWNGNPFSSYALAENVWIDGALMYDRRNPARQPVSDFSLGQSDSQGGTP